MTILQTLHNILSSTPRLEADLPPPVQHADNDVDASTLPESKVFFHTDVVDVILLHRSSTCLQHSNALTQEIETILVIQAELNNHPVALIVTRKEDQWILGSLKRNQQFGFIKTTNDEIKAVAF